MAQSDWSGLYPACYEEYLYVKNQKKKKMS